VNRITIYSYNDWNAAGGLGIALNPGLEGILVRRILTTRLQKK
jgi:hypothetical protein